jgi:class 3 adenylate cyclase
MFRPNPTINNPRHVVKSLAIAEGSSVFAFLGQPHLVPSTTMYPRTERDGVTVPEPSNLQLGNDGVSLEATVLYADMAGSTNLVDEQSPKLAAEVYKCYLACAARIIKQEEGSTTAYDGDRIMDVFIGNVKNTTAARTAMKIHWAVKNIVIPPLRSSTAMVHTKCGM